MRKLVLILCALMFGLTFAQDYVMGINFDAGGKFDKSFNEGTFNGFTKAVDELQGQYDIQTLEFEGTPETFAQGLRQMASQGADLIIAPGFSQGDAVHNLSSEFPDTYFVNLDGGVETPNANEAYISFKEHEGSYLVGYLAGTLSQTGTVGFVGGMDIPLIHNFETGYEQGVMAACPDCKVVSNYVGVTPAAWNDPAKAKELATTQQAQGADIIYAAAGASGNGVIDFVNETMCYTASNLRETPLTSVVAALPKSDAYTSACAADAQPLFFIGVDSNQNYLGDTDNDPQTLNHGLTSMMKRVDVAAYNEVMNVVNDTFESGSVSLGLAEDGVGYALDEYNQPLIPQTVLDAVEAAKADIASGTTKVESYYEQTGQ